jgi:hypothetical protein
MAILRKSLEENRPNMVEGMRTKVLTTNLYTYRYASDDDLEKYVAFCESPLGQWWDGVRYNAIKVASVTTAQKALQAYREGQR